MKIICVIFAILCCAFAQEISKEMMVKLLSQENESGTEKYSFS
jgi:hypothetical protein